MRLLVGLGNPGPKYETTNHNVGFLLVEELADEFGLAWAGEKFKAQFAKGTVLGEPCYLIKPQTFMNRSGQSVAGFMSFFKIPPDDVVVLHDDIDMDVGRVKARQGGGHGGNNGVRDIIASIGTADFHRIKVGVGRGDHGNVTDHVLKPMGDELLEALQNEVKDEVLLRLKQIFQRQGAKT